MNKPYMTKRHLVLEILSYVLLLVCFIIAIVGMATLPDEIPTHFTMSGEIDGYGSPGTLFDSSYYHADLQWHDQSDHACYAANHVEYAVKAETAKCGQGITGYDIHDRMDGAGDQRIYPVSHDQHLPGKRCGLGYYYSICGSTDSDDHLLYSCIPEA